MWFQTALGATLPVRRPTSADGFRKCGKKALVPLLEDSTYDPRSWAVQAVRGGPTKPYWDG